MLYLEAASLKIGSNYTKSKIIKQSFLQEFLRVLNGRPLKTEVRVAKPIMSWEGGGKERGEGRRGARHHVPFQFEECT